MSSPKPWSPTTSFGGLLITAGSRMADQAKNLLKETGTAVSLSRIGVLSLLQQSPRTQADLCRALRQAPPSMMDMLARLKRDGLADSDPDPEDRRKVLWRLTTAGEEAVQLVRSSFVKEGRRVDKLFQRHNFDQQSIEQFKSMLRLLIDELYSDRSDAS